MANILIVADGKISQKFIETIKEKSLKEHTYTVIVKDKGYVEDGSSNINYTVLDATSLYRIKDICSVGKYKTVFIVVEDMKESKTVYKNIRTINKKVRVVALDTDEIYKEIKDSYLNIVDVNMIISNRLYDFLPDVPVTAQTIGLNEGEIMEINIPFSSTYAFRHIGSIPQVKWRIVALYRDDKLLLPNSATMLRPRDRILIVGKPQVLATVYKKIKSSNNIFPEPYGKNFYLYLDIDKDGEKAIEYIQDAIYFLDKFDNKNLIIRVTNPNNFKILTKILSFESKNIRCYISYLDITTDTISSDIIEHEIGLILLSFKSLKYNGFSKELHDLKKLIYIFGDRKISEIKEVTIVKSDSRVLEEISSIVFYIAETLKVNLTLREYDPSGKFKGSKEFIEHYETLAHAHNTKLTVIQQKKNPIKATKYTKNILLVVPFRRELNLNSFIAFFKKDVDSLLIRTSKHPKLLIPVEE